MEKEFVYMVITGLSVIASTYFWLDRKSTNARITGKGAEIKALDDKLQDMKVEVTGLKSKLESNEKIEEMRTKLLEQSLSNMEKSIAEIKGDMKMLTESILKSLTKQNG